MSCVKAVVATGRTPTAAAWVRATGQGRVHTIHDAEQVNGPALLADTGIDLANLQKVQSFTAPEATVVELPRASVWSSDGVVGLHGAGLSHLLHAPPAATSSRSPSPTMPTRSNGVSFPDDRDGMMRSVHGESAGHSVAKAGRRESRTWHCGCGTPHSRRRPPPPPCRASPRPAAPWPGGRTPSVKCRPQLVRRDASSDRRGGDLPGRSRPGNTIPSRRLRVQDRARRPRYQGRIAHCCLCPSAPGLTALIPGLYVTGNASAAVLGHSYAGAGSTIGPAMTFGYMAANDIADHAGS
jgi:hypothetical protein